MMKLLKYEGYKVTIEPEILVLSPFKTIWDRDDSETKERAIAEIAFIYFYSDPRSDYQYIIDPKDREKEIKAGEGMPSKWRPDKTVRDAIALYESFKPTSALLLEDTRYAVDKLRHLLREIDLNQTDDKGKPIYTLNTITATIKQIPSLVKDLDEAEKALSKEIKEEGRMRGSAEKSIMEDDLDI